MAELKDIGEYRFDPLTGELSGPSGHVVLRPQTANVLAVLVDQAGVLVSKDTLMDKVWRDTYVTDDSIVQCISEIRKAIGSSNKISIITIPKKGYRLDLQPPVTASEARGKEGRSPGRQLPALVTFIALLIFTIGGAALWTLRWQKPEVPITVAVLPFLNMSGDKAQTYFSNGMAEDLIVRLSNISDLRVLSRGTSFSVTQGERDLREVADALNADYVLEGSVRRVNNLLRISASLVDGDTGANIWAERFEGTPDDIFDFQDEVVDALVRTLSVRLSRAERERLGVRGTENIEAHDAYLLGRELENLYTRDTNLLAEEVLQRAVGLDPKFALAFAHLAQVYSFRVENNWTNEKDRYIRAAFESAERAVGLDPDLPFAHFSLGRLYTRSFSPDPERAARAYNTAIRLDPNYADAYVFLANIHIFNGRAEEAAPLVKEGFQRNPTPPYWYYLTLGMAQYFLGNYEAAETALVRARDRNPTAPYPYRFLIATYGQTGDIDEAEWMTMEYEALGRIATVEALLASASIQDADYRKAFAEGFRKAGMLED